MGGVLGGWHMVVVCRRPNMMPTYPARGLTVLQEHTKGSSKLREKAHRAAQEGLQALHLFSQLDALMRAILKVGACDN
jgi:hypothetical protein